MRRLSDISFFSSPRGDETSSVPTVVASRRVLSRSTDTYLNAQVRVGSAFLKLALDRPNGQDDFLPLSFLKLALNQRIFSTRSSSTMSGDSRVGFSF